MSQFENLFSFSFFNKITSFSILDTVAALLLSFIIGLFIYLVYKKTFKGVMYSESFGISLIAMNLITTLVILAVSSNLITSLGMVGALSIVRFRTVVKEPLDLVYLFWAITSGIIVGVGLIPLAIIGSVIVGLILMVFSGRSVSDTPYIVIVNCAGDIAEQESLRIIREQTKKQAIKSKTVSQIGSELTVEVRLKEGTGQFLNNILAVEGVENAVLVSYNGDYYM